MDDRKDTESIGVTPWEVTEDKVDYDRLIDSFGCSKVDEAIVKRFEKYGKVPIFLTRGIVFAHRDLNILLDHYESGKPFYLYTGRGPSSSSMHIGHAIPFLFVKKLQDLFDVPLVIQMTDDEKFLFRDLTLEQCKEYANENIKDIIAFGFDPKKTFIFINTEYAHKFIKNTLTISKNISLHEGQKVFGFQPTTSSLGMVNFPCIQIAPAFSSAFDFLTPDHMCLIPCAIDQDPYFRLARDIAKKLESKKPVSIYSKFLPGLLDGKMSASGNATIFLTDTPDQIKKKILGYAYSGGRDTLKEHRKYGGNPDVDISFQYLRFFLEDEEELNEIERKYRSGELLSSEMKQKCIDEISKFVLAYQEIRKKVTEEDVEKFKTEISLYKK